MRDYESDVITKGIRRKLMFSL